MRTTRISELSKPRKITNKFVNTYFPNKRNELPIVELTKKIVPPKPIVEEVIHEPLPEPPHYVVLFSSFVSEVVRKKDILRAYVNKELGALPVGNVNEYRKQASIDLCSGNLQLSDFSSEVIDSFAKKYFNLNTKGMSKAIKIKTFVENSKVYKTDFLGKEKENLSTDLIN